MLRRFREDAAGVGEENLFPELFRNKGLHSIHVGRDVDQRPVGAVEHLLVVIQINEPLADVIQVETVIFSENSCEV